MKIRFWLLSFFILLFCGCSAKEPPKPLTEFCRDAVVCVGDSLQGGCEFKAQVASNARGVLCVTITNPPELSGLCCKWGEEFEMSYKELSVQGDWDYLPEFSFQRVIRDVLENLEQEPVCTEFTDEFAIFEGSFPSGEYTAVTDSKGVITKISVEELNLTIELY